MYVSNNPNNITPNIERRLRFFISLCNNLRYRQIPTFVCRTTGEFIIQVCLCLVNILLVRATSDSMQSKNVRKNTFAISRTTFNIVGFKCVYLYTYLFYYTISTETDFGLTYIHKQRKLNIQYCMAWGHHTIFVSSQGSCSFYQFLLYRIVSCRVVYA